MAQLAACKHPAACSPFEAVLLPSRRGVPALEIQMLGHILAENQIIRGEEGAVSLCCQLSGIWQQLPLNGGLLALQDIFQLCYSLMECISSPGSLTQCFALLSVGKVSQYQPQTDLLQGKFVTACPASVLQATSSVHPHRVFAILAWAQHNWLMLTVIHYNPGPFSAGLLPRHCSSIPWLFPPR